jgi:hypothetical protein
MDATNSSRDDAKEGADVERDGRFDDRRAAPILPGIVVNNNDDLNAALTAAVTARGTVPGDVFVAFNTGERNALMATHTAIPEGIFIEYNAETGSQLFDLNAALSAAGTAHSALTGGISGPDNTDRNAEPTASVTIHSAVSGGIFVAYYSGLAVGEEKNSTIDVVSLPTNDVVATVTVLASMGLQQLLIDRTGTKLVTRDYDRADIFSLQPMCETAPVISFPLSLATRQMQFSNNGSLLLYIAHPNHGTMRPTKEYHVVDAETGHELWTHPMKLRERTFDAHDNSVMSTFTNDDRHIALLYNDYGSSWTGAVCNRATISFQDSRSGAVVQAALTQVSPFSADAVGPGVDTSYALLVAGTTENNQPAVFLVGSDLLSSRLCVIPESVYSPTNGSSRFIRWGPQNSLIVDIQNTPFASVFSCVFTGNLDKGPPSTLSKMIGSLVGSSQEIEGFAAKFTKLSELRLSKSMGRFDVFASDSAMNRFAIAFNNSEYHVLAPEVVVYDVILGEQVQVYHIGRAQILQLGSVDVMNILM